MRQRAEQKRESRERLLAAAGRSFRRSGYGGIGVDGLAKAAGLTSGAFYVHFKSKDAAFAEVAVTGLDRLHDAVADHQTRHGTLWLDRFIDAYLGVDLRGEMEEACGLYSLSPDVMRADEGLRGDYEAALLRVVRKVAEGLNPALGEAQRMGKASSLLALLSGGATMVRSMATAEARWVLVQGLKRGAAALLAEGV